MYTFVGQTTLSAKSPLSSETITPPPQPFFKSQSRSSALTSECTHHVRSKPASLSFDLNESDNGINTCDEPELKQVFLSFFGWKKLTPEEAIAQNKRDLIAVRKEAEVKQTREVAEKQMKQDKKHEATKKWVQLHRAKVRKDVGDHGHKAKRHRIKEMVLYGENSVSEKMVDLMETLRPDGKK